MKDIITYKDLTLLLYYFIFKFLEISCQKWPHYASTPYGPTTVAHLVLKKKSLDLK